MIALRLEKVFMKEIDLRNKFIEFFESKGHVKVPSAPVVPENDPQFYLIPPVCNH